MAKPKVKYLFNEDGTVTFRHSDVGSVSRTTYEGVYRVKSSLSPYDELAAGRDFRDLLGARAEMATDHESNIAFALSHLRYRLVEYPSFWREKSRDGYLGADLDANILIAVLDLALNAQFESNRRLKAEAKRRLGQMAKALEEADKEGAEEPDVD